MYSAPAANGRYANYCQVNVAMGSGLKTRHACGLYSLLASRGMYSVLYIGFHSAKVNFIQFMTVICRPLGMPYRMTLGQPDCRATDTT